MVRNSKKLIEDLAKKGVLKIIDQELDVNLEIPHLAYIEIKKKEPKVLLFTNPVDKKLGLKYEMPVLMNIFSSYELTEFYLGRPVKEIEEEIESLLKLKPPASFGDKIDLFKKLFSLKSVFPKRENTPISKTHKKYILDLNKLPILKTWEFDGGKFITMGQVFTQSLNGNISNVGMYRLQVFDEKTLGMHWQIHKDSTVFYNEFMEAGKDMPVAIAIGGDPVNTWIATAPLPHGINEMLLYGFVKKENAKLVKTNNGLFVPADADIVIEGFVKPNSLRVEGPFGDHTGYYTLEEEYPTMEVTNIWISNLPIYYATVVGKPPLEDKYMGWATERIFLPLLKTTAPDLIDYVMPENGVFHNLIIAKMKTKYKGHALQFMHAFWGVGQMSFVKHAIFVDEKAPELTDYQNLIPYILNHFSSKDFVISKGVLDALDHSSPESLVGGKLGIDATGETVKLDKIEEIPENELFEKIVKIAENIQNGNEKQFKIKRVKTFFNDTQNPITVCLVEKNGISLKNYLPQFKELKKHVRILVFLDFGLNFIEDTYMLVWRVVNNIDAQRDLLISDDFYVLDATNKIPNVDEVTRDWPKDVECNNQVLGTLVKKGFDITTKYSY